MCLITEGSPGSLCQSRSRTYRAGAPTTEIWTLDSTALWGHKTSTWGREVWWFKEDIFVALSVGSVFYICRVRERPWIASWCLFEQSSTKEDDWSHYAEFCHSHINLVGFYKVVQVLYDSTSVRNIYWYLLVNSNLIAIAAQVLNMNF